MRSKTIPVVDYSLGEEVLSDIQSAWLFVYLELMAHDSIVVASHHG